MQDKAAQDWPGKADGVPPPPTRADIDEVSSQQGLITDEWAPETAPSAGHAPPEDAGGV